MQNRNIIIIATQPWDIEIGSNCKNMALEFARTNKVLYVNAPIDRRTLQKKSNEGWVKKRKQVIDKKIPAIEQVSDSIWSLIPDFKAESINLIPVNAIHDFFNKQTNRKLAACISKAARELGFTDYVVFNDSMMIRGFYLKELLAPALHIYYIRDYLISQPYFKKHGARLEKELIRKSDIVLANSVFLRDYAGRFNTNSHYVGQGCEIDIFSPELERAKPAELEKLTSPIIGYVGFLTAMRLDISLIKEIAMARPHWNFVLAGPEDEAFRNSDLHALSNVLFTGKKRPEELPAYVQYFDVCINPQAINDLTIGNYPRKVDEYLAMGKPVVATHTQAMEVFQEYCSLATGRDQYISMIEKAMAENSDEKKNSRIQLAQSHTWENNVIGVYKVIKENT